MNDLMYIPKILNVGYQERNDTYSGKLEALRSEDLRVADELDQLESLLK